MDQQHSLHSFVFRFQYIVLIYSAFRTNTQEQVFIKLLYARTCDPIMSSRNNTQRATYLGPRDCACWDCCGLLLPNFLMSIRLLCDRAAGGAMHVDTYCGAIELGVLCGLHVILLLVKRTHSDAQRSVLCNQRSHDLQMQRQMCWHLFGVTNFTWSLRKYFSVANESIKSAHMPVSIWLIPLRMPPK